jgi:hypothetical protein
LGGFPEQAQSTEVIRGRARLAPLMASSRRSGASRGVRLEDSIDLNANAAEAGKLLRSNIDMAAHGLSGCEIDHRLAGEMNKASSRQAIRTLALAGTLLTLGLAANAFERVWSDTLGWTPLKGLKPLRAQGSMWFRSAFALKSSIKVLRTQYQREQYIGADANGEITFELPLEQKITGFRAFAGLRDGGTKGSVIFRVKADDTVVFTSEMISHAKGNKQRIEVAFPPARTITLITDPSGDDQEDWSVWIEPQVRSAK